MECICTCARAHPFCISRQQLVEVFGRNVRLRDNCSQDNSKTLETLNKNGTEHAVCWIFITPAPWWGLASYASWWGGGGGVAQRAPLRIFKSKSRRDTPSKCVCITCAKLNHFSAQQFGHRNRLGKNKIGWNNIMRGFKIHFCFIKT